MDPHNSSEHMGLEEGGGVGVGGRGQGTDSKGWGGRLLVLSSSCLCASQNSSRTMASEEGCMMGKDDLLREDLSCWEDSSQMT